MCCCLKFFFAAIVATQLVIGGVISSSKIESCINTGESPITCKKQLLVTMSVPGVAVPDSTQQVTANEERERERER